MTVAPAKLIPVRFCKIALPLFPGKVALCIADELKDAWAGLNDHFYRCHPDFPKFAEDGGVARTYHVYPYVGLSFQRRDLTHGIIAHEVTHAVGFILKRVGVEADHENNETAAYLAGWLTEWVYRMLGKAGEKVGN